MALSDATRTRARQAGWSDALIERLEGSPLRESQVLGLIALRLKEERAEKYVSLVEANPDAPFSKLTFNWARPSTELGIRAQPGPNGLGVPEINIGTYGHVPDRWPYENDTPLGSHPTPGSYAPGPYSVYDKSEVWAEGVDHLYEQAIRERWAPATDIAWGDLEPQADDLERAICQLCTAIAQHGFAEQKVIAAWEEKIAYGFHDVKDFLATQIFDAGRKVEVLRKRALANGGGLARQGLGTLYRAWFGALKTTELLTAIDVVYKTYELAMFEWLAEKAPLAVDRDIFARLARDSRRHITYGERHLRYYLQHHPNGRDYMVFFLNRAEGALSDELRHSPVETEALAIIAGGGVENIQAGLQQVTELRRKQFSNYMTLLDGVGFDRLKDVDMGLVALAEGRELA